jgi:hypothetical protein
LRLRNQWREYIMIALIGFLNNLWWNEVQVRAREHEIQVQGGQCPDHDRRAVAKSYHCDEEKNTMRAYSSANNIRTPLDSSDSILRCTSFIHVAQIWSIASSSPF